MYSDLNLERHSQNYSVKQKCLDLSKGSHLDFHSDFLMSKETKKVKHLQNYLEKQMYLEKVMD